MAAALGVGAREGEVVVSLGTSGTAFAVSTAPTHDASGLVAGFSDATGRYLPLACTLNCTVPVNVIAGWFAMDLASALDAADRPTDVVFLPYLRGERTPDLPNSSGAMIGLREDTTPAELLAAAVQGAAAGLALGVRALVDAGVPAPASLVLVGGGARHPTWLKAIASATGLPVTAPEGDDHAARGMAAQARAVVEGARVRDIAEAWRPAVAHQVSAGAIAAVPGTVDHDVLRQALRPIWP
jgi:xylulokinase